jgi:phage gpG-like protein
MGWVDLRFEAFGQVEINRRLDLGKRSISDIRPIAPEMFAILEEEVIENFGSEGRSAGKPFRRLTPEYLKWKKKAHARNPVKYPGTSILELSGRLVNSLANPAGSADSIRIARPNQIVYGTKVPYAITQAQQGRNAIQLSGRAPQRLTEVIRLALTRAMRSGVQPAHSFWIDR